MKRFLNSILFTMLFAAVAVAQLTTGNLIGTVSSPDGLLPGASVVVINDQTNKEITAVTDDQGGFKVTNLEIGTYTVRVNATGFKNFTATSVKIDINKDYSLPIALEVGGVNETVEVVAGADVINSTDATITGVVTTQQLQDLPTLGRNPINFINLQAGVSNNPSQPATINGVRTSATNITIEGINVQDPFIRSNATEFAPGRPSVEEVEEFAVTGQANVDSGFGAGQIQFGVRRGSNDFRGSAFLFNRNSEFGANTFFNNAAPRTPAAPNGVERPFRNRNDFGGRVGGPIVKDRLFFFGFAQRFIDISPTSSLITVLTPGARQGDFTYTALDGTRRTVNLFNAALAQTTGITGISPTIRSRVLSRLTQGNSLDAGDQLVTTGARLNQNFNQVGYNVTTRFDFEADDQNRVRAIYRYADQELNRADVDVINPIPTVVQPSTNKQLSLGYVFTPTNGKFTNEVVGGFFFSDPTFDRTEAAPNSFFTGAVGTTLITNTDVTFLNQGRTAKTWNLQNNATYTTGNHSFRFGGQFQNVGLRIFNDAGIVPTYTLGVNQFTPQITPAQFANTALFPGGVPAGAQRTAANNLLALLGGIVSAGTATFNATDLDAGFAPGATNNRRVDFDQYALYVNDQWRATSELTLNLGIRYDYFTPVRSGDNLFLEPVIPEGTDAVSAVLDPNGRYQVVGGNAGSPGAFSRPDKNNFAPSISFAYAPRSTSGVTGLLFGEGRTVLRGGYRRSFFNDEYVASTRNALVGNQGLTFGNNAFNPANGTVQLNARADALPVINAPAFNLNRTYLLNNQLAGNFGTVFAVDPDIKIPSVDEYSFGIQRELGFSTVLEVRYVGTRSDNLLRGLDYNQIDIRNNNFAADFIRARQNFFLTGDPYCTTAGCQALTVFPNLVNRGNLTNANNLNNLINGTVADLALNYITAGQTGAVRFLANPNTGVANVLSNNGSFRYNSLQVELRRRFAGGIYLQANYTFSKNLTDTQGAQSDVANDSQSRFEANLDNAQPELERARALTDQTHIFNLNGVFQLPFGKGRRFFNDNTLVDYLIGGIEINPIVRLASGAPISIQDPIGTLNRAARSFRQTARTNLTGEELQNLVGIFRTPNGIFFLNPSVLGRNPDGSLKPGRDGRGISSQDPRVAPFEGQVFFSNQPGTTSALGRTLLNGPRFFNTDISLIKRFSIGENGRFGFQIQADVFNVFNTVNFIVPQSLNINSGNFGRITATPDFDASGGPRVIQLGGRINF